MTFNGGYAGTFADFDGHAQEIAHHPGFPLAEDDSLTIPDSGAAWPKAGSCRKSLPGRVRCRSVPRSGPAEAPKPVARRAGWE